MKKGLVKLYRIARLLTSKEFTLIFAVAIFALLSASELIGAAALLVMYIVMWVIRYTLEKQDAAELADEENAEALETGVYHQAEQRAQEDKQRKAVKKSAQEAGMPNNIIEVEKRFLDKQLNKALLDDKIEEFVLLNVPCKGTLVCDEEGNYNKFFQTCLKLYTDLATITAIYK